MVTPMNRTPGLFVLLYNWDVNFLSVNIDLYENLSEGLLLPFSFIGSIPVSKDSTIDNLDEFLVWVF